MTNGEGHRNLGNGISYTVDEIDHADWDRVLEEWETANIYQSSAYAAIQYSGAETLRLGIYREKELIAASLVRIIRLPFLGPVMAYVYRGPVWKGPANDRDSFRIALLCLKDFSVSARRIPVVLVPYLRAGDTAEDDLKNLGFRRNPRIRPYHTRLIDLDQDEEELLRQCSKKWRENLRRGNRGEFRVETGSDGPLLAEFLDLFREMNQRKGFVERIDIEDFVTMQPHLPPDLKLKVILCREENGLSSGILYTDMGNTVIPLFSATATWALKLRRSYALRWELLLRSKRNGLSYFDQGGLNETRNPGSYHFKKGMGGEELDFISQYEYARTFWSRFVVRMVFRLKDIRNDIRDKMNTLTRK